jgi:hypothetical protein
MAETSDVNVALCNLLAPKRRPFHRLPIRTSAARKRVAASVPVGQATDTSSESFVNDEIGDVGKGDVASRRAAVAPMKNIAIEPEGLLFRKREGRETWPYLLNSCMSMIETRDMTIPSATAIRDQGDR